MGCNFHSTANTSQMGDAGFYLAVEYFISITEIQISIDRRRFIGIGVGVSCAANNFFFTHRCPTTLATLKLEG